MAKSNYFWKLCCDAETSVNPKLVSSEQSRWPVLLETLGMLNSQPALGRPVPSCSSALRRRMG